MIPNRNRFTALLVSLFALLLLTQPVLAQSSSRLPAKTFDLGSIRPTERITGVIDDRLTVTRPGNRHPLARPEFDAGAVAPDTRLDRMLLVLEPDAVQKKALDELLAAQQDPESPYYHQWLTPEAFGERFGVAERDYRRIVEWLEAQGFDVEPASPSRREIIFSGTAAHVRAAFGTEVHRYRVDGATHYANAADPEIPAALSEVVAGVLSMHDFHAKPMHRGVEPADFFSPEFTSGSAHYMTPADFGIIYDVSPLYTQSIDGNGQSVAIAGRSNFKMSDVTTFRSQFGLPAKNPVIVLNGPDPGIVSTVEATEAILDVEWSGAVAKNATIQFVLSGSTNTSDGVALSSQYIISHNLAPVMSLSFGNCEAAIGSSGNSFWNSLWQQAAAQGISVLVSSGDSGAAGCDSPSVSQATHSAGVNGLCSPPFSTCVGGTQFSDTSNPNVYWSSTNASGTGASALSYIPEATWNSSGAVSGGSGLWAGGGGASLLYLKPSWQAGPGVPTDNRRYVPDVSLNSSTHDGYLILLNGQLYSGGGTSAAAPALAGLLALTVQRTGARLGNANPAFYALASRQATGGSAVFHDITAGNNTVPGLTGFNAGTGYDAATGLGSVDASQLVNHWSDSTIPTPSIRLSASPASVSVTQGANVSVTLTVTVSGGFNSAVALSATGLPTGLTASFTPASLPAPGSGASTLKLTASSTAAPSSFNVTMAASGGGLTQTFPLAVTILPNCTYSITPASATLAAGAGSYSFNVTAQTGCPWAASSTSNWIAFPSGNTGSGSGKVTYSVSLNNSLASRSGQIGVAGRSFGVTQGAATAVFSLNPSSATFPASGGGGNVALTANPSNATWTAKSNVTWITITSGASGSGSKTIAYTVAANTGSARTGTLTIAGLTFTVTQAGTATCTYQVSIGPISSGPSGFTGSISVFAAPGCAWTAVSNASWLTIMSASSGSGNGTVSYLAAPNTTTSTRSGVLTIAGYALTFTEPGASSKPNVTLAPIP